MSRPSEIARQIDEIVYHIKGKKVRIQKEREAIEQDKRERNELMKGRDKLEDEIEELKKKIDREQSRISKKEKEVDGMINNIKGLVNDLVKIKEEYEKGMVSPNPYSKEEPIKDICEKVVNFLRDEEVEDMKWGRSDD